LVKGNIHSQKKEKSSFKPEETEARRAEGNEGM
jgi:hypothetical protein